MGPGCRLVSSTFAVVVQHVKLTACASGHVLWCTFSAQEGYKFGLLRSVFELGNVCKANLVRFTNAKHTLTSKLDSTTNQSSCQDMFDV